MWPTSTWDGAAIAAEPPNGASIVVRRGGDYLVLAQVPEDVVISLDAEHVEYGWVSLDDALRLCRPQTVADGLALAGLV